MTDIREPQETGSAGTQTVQPTEVLVVPNQGSFDSLPITRAMEGLAATRSRSMGGEVAAGLIAGSFTQLSHELTETKGELKTTRHELKTAEQSLSDIRSQNATLTARARTVDQYKNLSNIAIFSGTLLIGLSIELYRNTFLSGAMITTVTGILLVLLGWITPAKEMRQ